MSFARQGLNEMMRDVRQKRQRRPLLSNRAGNTSTNDTGELLATHGVEQTNTPADDEDHEDREGADEPEGHDDVLLLAGGAAPAGGLLGAVRVCADFGLTSAGVALAAQVAGVLVGVRQDTRAVASAVAGHGLTGGQGGEAARKNTSERSGLVVGLVRRSLRGKGGLKVRSGLGDLGD